MVTVEISYGSGKGVPQKDDLYELKHPTSLGFVSEKMMCVKSLLSCPTLCDPMVQSIVACQVPLSMGFFRQGYWSGMPCPPPGDLLDPGTELALLCLLQVGSLPLVPPREKVIVMHYSQLKQVKSA